MVALTKIWSNIERFWAQIRAGQDPVEFIQQRSSFFDNEFVENFTLRMAGGDHEAGKRIMYRLAATSGEAVEHFVPEWFEAEYHRENEARMKKEKKEKKKKQKKKKEKAKKKETEKKKKKKQRKMAKKKETHTGHVVISVKGNNPKPPSKKPPKQH